MAKIRTNNEIFLRDFKRKQFLYMIFRMKGLKKWGGNLPKNYDEMIDWIDEKFEYLYKDPVFMEIYQKFSCPVSFDRFLIALYQLIRFFILTGMHEEDCQSGEGGFFDVLFDENGKVKSIRHFSDEDLELVQDPDVNFDLEALAAGIRSCYLDSVGFALVANRLSDAMDELTKSDITREDFIKGYVLDSEKLSSRYVYPIIMRGMDVSESDVKELLDSKDMDVREMTYVSDFYKTHYFPCRDARLEGDKRKKK